MASSKINNDPHIIPEENIDSKSSETEIKTDEDEDGDKEVKDGGQDGGED